MKRGPRPRLIIAVLSGAFTLVLLPLATNIATSTLPEWIEPYTWLAWPVLLLLAPLAVALTILEIKSNRPPDDITKLAIANRDRMLAEVRRIWIDGYLKQSLDNLVRIELELEETPDAVSRPFDLIVQQPDRTPRALPPGRSIAAVFDELSQALLILGAPGAGKTTLLLELTRDLLDRAAQDAMHPIPVVFHLASWAVRRRPLADWLVDELAERYYVPRKLAQAWTDAEQVLPLLDGLDEVAPEHRAACVEAITTFRRQHPFVPLAVCSRVADYEALPVRVALSGAIVIQPLSREKIRTYLKQAGKALAGVRWVLRDDETLWELLATPLMLSIVALAYQGWSAAEVRATGSLEQRRAHLFETYTRRMFERRSKITVYSPEQTTRWLTWLAQSLTHNNLSVFYVERMQPDWLSSRMQQWIVFITLIIASWLFSGAGFGLAFGVPFGLEAGLIDGLTFGLLSGLFFGLVFGLVFGLLSGRGRITPAETLRWSWRQSFLSILVAGLIVSVFRPKGWLVYLVLFGVGGGSTTGQVATRTIPNEGIRRSLQSALISFLTFGLIGGLVGGLVSGLGGGLVGGLVGGLGAGLLNGGSAYLKHYVLRFLLWRNDYAPLNYIRFLDYAAERVFLRKVGGGYIFTHRLLMEYFATLQSAEQVFETERSFTTLRDN